MNKKNTGKGLMIVLLLLMGISGLFLAVRKRWLFEKTPVFLPGIYVCLAQNEFCRIADTLVIRRTRNAEDNYLLTRATCFVRIRAGKRDPPECQQQHWIGRYDPEKRWLIPVEEGDTVRYDPEKNQVWQSAFYYEKIE